MDIPNHSSHSIVWLSCVNYCSVSAEGKSLCMQHLCREGDVKSLKDWIDKTRELMVENRTDDNLPAPEISATDADPFDITQYM